MKRNYRKWGRTAIALLFAISLLAPPASHALPRGTERPTEDGGGVVVELDTVGDPNDGGGGRPQPSLEDNSIVSLIVRHYLLTNVDCRLLQWLPMRLRVMALAQARGR